MRNGEALCDGCTRCSMRCTDGIKISEFEYTRMVAALRTQEPCYARTVLAQSKILPWFQEITYTACLFLDVDSRRCLVYPARPLVCRLFGQVWHLPCPIAPAPAERDVRELLAAYTSQPLHTFQEWMMAAGLFNFETLIGKDC